MSVLDDIIKGVREDLARREASLPLEELKKIVENQNSAQDVLAWLNRDDAPQIQVFAEVKRASPSKGKIAKIPAPGILASEYQAGGASVISCLTEERRFCGSLEDIAQVRASVDIPVLRKDFIVSPYQILEARAWGADLVLLIVSALDENALRCLLERTRSIGMEALVEVHSRVEAYLAMEAGARIIGVNARNLQTLEVDMDIVPQVLDVIPSGYFKVGESGVRDAHDVLEYARAGADAVLVGEALVKDAAPRDAVAQMVALGLHPSIGN